METIRLDAATAPAATADALHEVEVAALAVDEPDRPPPAVADLDRLLRVSRADRRTQQWLVVDGGRPIARSWLTLPDRDNRHTAFFSATVSPTDRRRGVGTGLLRAAVDVLVAEGRRAVLIEALAGSAGAAFCDAFGLEEAQADRSSVLRLALVDRADVESLAAAAHPGYRLVGWQDGCPEELLDSYARAKQAMNDAPTGSMDWERLEYSGRHIRADEDVLRRRGWQWRVVVAVHEPSGEVAGLTEVIVSRWSPVRAETDDTAVVPAHRGTGLGLWIKAEMVRRLLAERPDVVEVVTRNGLTNEHMWRINARLGFRTYATCVERQARVAELAARLAARPPSAAPRP
jgi:GNAT superfamily N-acetyltransferase